MHRRKHAFRYIFPSVVIVAFLLLFSVCVTTASYAATTYTTPEFNVDVDVNEDYSFDYTETITVDYGNYAKHGIFRYIPLSPNYRLRDVTVDGYEYDVYNESDNLVIKIGSADYTVTGRQTYTIHYTIRCIEDSDNSMDFMNIDVLPTAWESPIEQASIKVNLPSGIQYDSWSYAVGPYGTTTDSSMDYGTWKATDHSFTYKVNDLPQGYGATLMATFPEGTWQNPLSYAWSSNIAKAVIALGILVLLALRLTWGRNPSVVETVEFYPPEGLTPLDIGYVIDGTVDDKDLTSTFFYLADKGYISIREYAKNEFEFTRLGNMYKDDEKKTIVRFYKGLFGSSSFDDYSSVRENRLTARSNKIGSRMYTAFRDIKEMVSDEFSGDNKLYSTKSKVADGIGKFMYFIVPTLVMILIDMQKTTFGVIPAIGIGITFGCIFTVIANKMCQIYYHRMSRKFVGTSMRLIVQIVIYVVIAVFYVAMIGVPTEGYQDTTVLVMLSIFFVVTPFLLLGMRSRTEKSAEQLGKVLGFKNFIQNAEIDKLEMLVEEDPSYFYNILPYAYVFGLTKKWASKFENIAIDPPGWYQPYGYDSHNYVFDSMVMNSMFDHVATGVTKSIAKSVAASSDHGGGGSFSGGGGGGGGFSGGGAGGGGGGTW